MELAIGDILVGDGHPCYVIGEIGINHNGSPALACKLIDAAAVAGCQAVKLQKRTIEAVYSQEELDRPRESPFGTTNRELKEALELTSEHYKIIDMHCCEQGLDWFASCWDVQSVDFIERFNPVAYKIASACLTDRELVDYTCSTGKPILLSTGMSTLEEIDTAVSLVRARGNDLAILHCTSSYPAKTAELNLKCLVSLRERYGCPIGYSGHEVGLATTVAAVAMGACIVERHITLDRSMFGSDQAASIEPHALMRLVRDIRTVESAMGDGIKRVYDSELPIREKLRKVPA